MRLKAVSPLYICDREQWQYTQTAAAKSVLTGGFDGRLRLTKQGRDNGADPRVEWLEAGVEHYPSGEKALHIGECPPCDAAAAYRQSPERRLPAAPDPIGGGAMKEFAEVPGSQWMESR